MSIKTCNPRTTVSLGRTTKSRMDKWRAAGQSYDGFLRQLMNLWETTHSGNELGETRFISGNQTVTSR